MVSLGLLVTFDWTIGVASPSFTRRAGPASQNYTQNLTKQVLGQAHEHTNTKKQKVQAPSEHAKKNRYNNAHANRGETFGPKIREVFFLRGGLFVQI